MKNLLLILVPAGMVALAGGLLFLRSYAGVQEASTDQVSGSLYDLQTRTLEGETAPLSAYRGRVALVVNLASKCGLTPQYTGLEALYRELAPRGFVILGFPSNDFMGQEPGTPGEIRRFCSTRYDVTFPLFEKVKVKGEDKSEVYSLLTRQLDEPDWNFTKYLVDAEGRVLYRFGPRTAPEDKELRARIEEALAAAKGAPLDERTLKIFDFEEPAEAAWRSIDDVVMGGVSSSVLRHTGEGTAVFSGEVSLENNGGFASVRTAAGLLNLSAYSGLEIRVQGDGKRYELRLRTDDRYDGVAYQAGFTTGQGVWQTVRLPFAEFKPAFRGRRLEGVEPLATGAISQIGLMIAGKQEGPFRLELDWLRAFKAD